MEKAPAKKHHIAGLLVRWRGCLLALMTLAALVCAVLIPRARINGDLTSALPDRSHMRHGIDILEQHFPQMDIRMQTLRVLFLAEPPADSLQTALDDMLEGERMMEVRQNGDHTLYQYMLPADTKGKAVKERLQERFGSRIIAEIEDNSGMPDNIGLMLVIGVVLVLAILLLMCPSVVEVVLFLLTIGIAVLINMGTNALLPSVHLLTHTLSAVLQLVLSMDYAIILMNRYRQEKQEGLEGRTAMKEAIAHAAPSILSSGLTTIASLLMLVFMQLKIGADLGIVLSKGVLCSLIATFTVLPALILRFEKAILATQKRVPQLRTRGLAWFEAKYRFPLAFLFVAMFVGSWFLQKRTTISYSVVWPTRITKEFPPRNTLMLLYPTQDEQALVPMAGQIAEIDGGSSILSYPTIALKPRTATELVAELAVLSPDLAGQVPQEAVDLVYYAATHPERKERMRFDELQPTADSLLELAGQFLPQEDLADITERFDVRQLVRQFSFAPLEPAPPAVQRTDAPSSGVYTAPAVENDPADLEYDPSAEADMTIESGPGPSGNNVETDAGQDTAFSAKKFTYEQVVQQRTAAEMAEILNGNPQQIAMVYRIGGAGRNGRPATLNMREFFQVVSEKVLSNKLYAAMVPKDVAAQFRTAKQDVDAIWNAGPTKPTAAAEEPVTPAVPDSIAIDATATRPVQQPDTPRDTPDTTAGAPAVETTPAIVPEAAPSPLERLADMAFSGQRYNAAQTHRALANAGISVRREEIDLLYLYHGYRTARDTSTQLSLMEVAGFLEDLADNPLIANYADSSQLAQLAGIRAQFDEGLGLFRSDPWSLAVIATDLPVESEDTFSFIDKIHSLSSENFTSGAYLVGHSQMYKEIKDGFPRELLMLTLLTVGAIFLIIALTFRSLIVPVLLIPTVLMAVWFNVAVSGIGGRTILFMAYLIVQGILMGAAIDYSILFTHYYRGARPAQGRATALATAYKGAIHTILTSGLILVLAPFIMSMVVSDPMIVSILRSISAGALAAILLILFALPATLVLFDRWITR